MDRPAETRQVSPFTQYRAVDVTMYDLIYGEQKTFRIGNITRVISGSHRSSAHTMTGYEFYKPLNTEILGRGRGRQYY